MARKRTEKIFDEYYKNIRIENANPNKRIKILEDKIVYRPGSNKQASADLTTAHSKSKEKKIKVNF